jgi:hypothetical protein
LLSILLSFVHFYFELLKISEIFRKRENHEEVVKGIIKPEFGGNSEGEAQIPSSACSGGSAM